jgi:hypothetical protein
MKKSFNKISVDFAYQKYNNQLKSNSLLKHANPNPKPLNEAQKKLFFENKTSFDLLNLSKLNKQNQTSNLSKHGTSANLAFASQNLKNMFPQ